MNELELNIIDYNLSKPVPLGTQKPLAIFDSSGRCYDPREDQSINCLSTHATKRAHLRTVILVRDFIANNNRALCRQTMR
jgi:hypothetical protein